MVKEEKMSLVRKKGRIDCCHRCGGLMVREEIFEIGSFDWRCVSCGERVDPVILAHREGHSDRTKDRVREEAEKPFTSRTKANLN